MRFLHSFEDPKEALQFSNFLKNEGIANHLDTVIDRDWGSSDYGTQKTTVWIIDEEDQTLSEKWLEEFLKTPRLAIFDQYNYRKTPLNAIQETLKEVPEKINKAGTYVAAQEKKGLGLFTLSLLIICTLLFIYGQFTEPKFQEAELQKLPALSMEPFFSPSINKKLYYDYPKAFEIVDELINRFGFDKLKKPEDLPLEGQLLLKQYFQTPYWQGVYDKITESLRTSKPIVWEAPLFEKIRHGEIWRLITPALLHLNVFHLFFNLMWLVVLGKLIEEKLGFTRYVLLFLIVGAVSNTGQYLMGGSSFIGISGIICGMLGFIWARQQVAAWEGYNLLPQVISFMFFFVASLAVWQTVAFILEVFWNINFTTGIANTAHIVGGLTGYFLGLLPFFSLKPKKNFN